MSVTIAQVRVDEPTARLLAAIHEESASAAYAHIFDDPFPTDETLERWRGYDGHVAVAEVDGRPVGLAAWHDDELDALYVLPEATGSGAGSALLAQAAGTTRLWVLADNAHARAFYEARGWRPTPVIRCVYGEVREVEYRRG